MTGKKHESPPCPPEHSDLEEKIVRLEADGKDKLDGWQRALADYQNLKREWLQKQDTIARDARIKMLRDLLPTVTTFQEAAKTLQVEGNPWAEGMRHISSQLTHLVSKWQVEKVPTVGEIFDPNIHEAVETRGTGHTVVAELSPGYTLDGQLIFPARVAVGDSNEAHAKKS